MRRTVVAAVAAVLTITPVLAGCGAGATAQTVVTRTVTAPPSAAVVTSAPSTVPSDNSASVDANTGTGTVPVAKFGDTVDLKDSQIKITMGTPKIWDGGEYGDADPSLYVKGSKTVVHIKLTVQNYGAYKFNPNYLNFTESIGNYSDWVTTASGDEAPTQIPAGQTESWTLETGGDAKGRLSIQIDDSSNQPLAYISNESQQ